MAAYHHGDLRRTLVAAAVEMIGEQGTAGVSLRDLARRAGVSHAAPTHHFRDKTGLFTAVAAEGFELLADRLAVPVPGGGAERLRVLGRRYVEFARDRRAHFTVMFSGLLRQDDPDLAAARKRAGAPLAEAVATLPESRRGLDPAAAVLAARSLAHGFATLLLAGDLDAALAGQDPGERFYELTHFLFA